MSTCMTEFEEHRERLSRLAYRMLGTHAEAEDVLQEAYLRWSRADRAAVESIPAYLTTVVTRLCIDRRREIDARKESYVGPWLPDPIVEPVPPPEQSLERAESISLAFLYVMERLTATERAAFLLRQVFGFGYSDVAEVLQTSSANCRQLVSRAERKVLEGRPRFDPDPAEVSRVSQTFLDACRNGDLENLLSLLSDDVVMISDGGGKASAALRPVVGADRVVRFFLGIARKTAGKVRSEPAWVNGGPGFVSYEGDELTSIYSIDVDHGRICGFYIVRNPDKLAVAVRERQSS